MDYESIKTLYISSSIDDVLFNDNKLFHVTKNDSIVSLILNEKYNYSDNEILNIIDDINDINVNRVEVNSEFKLLNYHRIVPILAKSSKYNNITEIMLNNSFEKTIPPELVICLKKFEFLDVLECVNTDYLQYLILIKNFKYIFSRSNSLDFKYLTHFSLPKTGNVFALGDGKFSLSNTKYSSVFAVYKLFNVDYAEDEIKKFVLLSDGFNCVDLYFKNIDSNIKNFVLKLASEFKMCGKENINFIFRSAKDDQLFKFTELNYLSDIEKNLNNLGYTLGFSVNHLYNNKNISEIYNASKNFDKNLSCVNSQFMNYSPYMRFLLCYYYAKHHYYYEHKDNVLKSKNIIDLMNSEGGDCNAFNTLLSLYLMKSNIKSQDETVLLYNIKTKKFEEHQRSIVRIKDDNFNINGIYIADPTFGALTVEDDDKSFSFAHMSIKTKFKNVAIKTKSPLMQVIYNNGNKQLQINLLKNPYFFSKTIDGLINLDYISADSKIAKMSENYRNFLYDISYDENNNVYSGKGPCIGDVYINQILELINQIEVLSKPISLDKFNDAMKGVMSKISSEDQYDTKLYSFLDHSIRESKNLFLPFTNDTFCIDVSENKFE